MFYDPVDETFEYDHTIDELLANLAASTRAVIEKGVSGWSGYSVQLWTEELILRTTIRDEILRIAEEMAEEQEAAEHREEAERTHRLAAARIANAAYEPTSTYYGSPSVSIKLL